MLEQTSVKQPERLFTEMLKNNEFFEFFLKNKTKIAGSGELYLRRFPRMEFEEEIIDEICSTSFRFKVGWRFTAGSTYGKSG